jgi:hypothetical protein
MKEGPPPGRGKMVPSTPTSGAQRSKRLRTITCASGIGAAGVGLFYVLTGNARVIDVVLLAGGILAALAGLTLTRRRNPAS